MEQRDLEMTKEWNNTKKTMKGLVHQQPVCSYSQGSFKEECEREQRNPGMDGENDPQK